ncbi:FAD-dependent oxidoreductase [Motilimonas pumila]|uniref:FAD-dependent oxidoreductase n=1 Tax=Motilimonas pumila TaxID=2303987 RepID=A0A418YFC9_9GAMM|nr:FAD-dependent oxidoreductase [Motilimonas pumila]RJG47960.1 FAD-dependent oxidoreductase [Motilimonas pumila]
MNNTAVHPNTHNNGKVAVIGAGVAGATIAMRLAELGVQVSLFEQGVSLVNGPPMCHLHAGGNLYREISDQQCLNLLEQSINTVRLYQHCVNVRPTVIAVPSQDAGKPEELFPRLNLLQQRYHQLVAEDVRNQVLGHPDNYFCSYQYQDLKRLAERPLPSVPSSNDDWMVPFAKQAKLEQLKYPVILVQEYGLSSLRIAATAALTLQQLPNCQVHTQTKVQALSQASHGWSLSYQNQGASTCTESFDFVVNASGFRSGHVDNMAQFKRQRIVEFKAAYLTWWQTPAIWPEVIFHGERGTPQGMAQLTPYCNGLFQLHGMTKHITLFKGGLVNSSNDDAQPALPTPLLSKIEQQWPELELQQRTHAAIEHLAQFIGPFASAKLAAKPLYGAQQIPGEDSSLRAAAVSFEGEHYARAEIVKASSALSSANVILERLIHLGLAKDTRQDLERDFKVAQKLTEHAVISHAIKLAKQRDYPSALALPYHAGYNHPAQVS